MNSVNITGRITKDAEAKERQDGGLYCYFCVAVDAGKDKNGDRITEFIDVIAYNQTANYLSTYVKKGDLIEVSGRLHTTLKEDSEGRKEKRVTVIAFSVNRLQAKTSEGKAPSAPKEQIAPDSEDLPFMI